MEIYAFLGLSEDQRFSRHRPAQPNITKIQIAHSIQLFLYRQPLWQLKSLSEADSSICIKSVGQCRRPFKNMRGRMATLST